MTYHVTKYEYPNLNESGNFNASSRGCLSDRGIISDPLTQLNSLNYRDLNSSRGLEHLFPDAKITSYDPILGVSKYDHAYHNPYGLYGTARDPSTTWPPSSNAAGSNYYRTAAHNIEGKPRLSCGPYPSFQQSCHSSSLPLPVPLPENDNNLDLNAADGAFPSFNQHVRPKSVLFNRVKQDVYHRD